MTQENLQEYTHARRNSMLNLVVYWNDNTVEIKGNDPSRISNRLLVKLMQGKPIKGWQSVDPNNIK